MNPRAAIRLFCLACCNSDTKAVLECTDYECKLHEFRLGASKKGGVMSESLTLKWGSLKAWDLKTDVSQAAMQKYFDAGKVSASAALQHDNEEQKEAICNLIDVIDCESIYLSWDDKTATKDEAKAYVLDYGKEEE